MQRIIIIQPIDTTNTNIIKADTIFPVIYDYNSISRNKKEYIAGFTKSIQGREVDVLKGGATYDILAFHQNGIMIAYLPETDLDDLEYGIPQYFKLTAMKQVTSFLENNYVSFFLMDFNVKVHIALIEVIKHNRFLRVLWNHEENEFVLSNVIKAMSITEYEKQLNL